jgi:hypothetical protein
MNKTKLKKKPLHNDFASKFFSKHLYESLASDVQTEVNLVGCCGLFSSSTIMNSNRKLKLVHRHKMNF